MDSGTQTAAGLSADVLVIGGGPAGTTTAARLRDARAGLDICIVDPEPFHDYQPAWTLVGAGSFRPEDARRERAACIPEGVRWLQSRVERFEPEQDSVVLDDGRRFRYRYLIVAAGIQTRWSAIEGLEATLGSNGVCSIYGHDSAAYTWQCLQEFSGGHALFTRPGFPIKCADSSQSILYLAADHFRRQGIAAQLEFLASGSAMHSVPYYAGALKSVAGHYGVDARFDFELIAVDGARREAIFERGESGAVRKRVVKSFDLLHVTPPQGPPEFIHNSTLADEDGWLEVERYSLRHLRHANIFGVGDCISVPTSKTVAAIRAQAPVVAANVAAALSGAPAAARYDGYSACPIATSNGKVLLAEFGYNGQVMPSFRPDPRIPRRRYWWLKRHYLPRLYWGMLDGNIGIDWHAPLADRGRRLPAFNP